MDDSTSSPPSRPSSPASSIDEPLLNTTRTDASTSVNAPTSGDASATRQVTPAQPDATSTVTSHVFIAPAPRRSKTRAERRELQGGKAGNPGKWKKEVVEAFTELLPEYLSRTKTTKGYIGRLKVFWYKATTVMWENMDVEDARAYVDIAGTMTEQKVGELIIEAMKNWFRWKEKALGGGNSALSLGLREAVLPKQEPRQRVVWQLYHHECGDLVTKEYNCRGGSAADDRIKVRNEIAQEQFNALPLERRQAYEAQAKAEHTEALERYHEAMNGSAENLDVETQREARAQLSRAIQPLFKEISRLTGLKNLTLLGGSAPDAADGDYLCMGLHYGQSVHPAGLNFAEYSPVGYSDNVLGQWAEFLQATSEATCLRGEDRRQRSDEPRKFTIELVDPYQREREDRAKELAAAENTARKKAKKNKKRTRPSTETTSGNAAASSSASPTLRSTDSPVSAGQATESEPSDGQAGGQPLDDPLPRLEPSIEGIQGESEQPTSSRRGPSHVRQSRRLSENANVDLRREVDRLDEEERRKEIERLNEMSATELARECERATTEAHGRPHVPIPDGHGGVEEAQTNTEARPIFSFLPPQGPIDPSSDFNDGLDMSVLAAPPFNVDPAAFATPGADTDTQPIVEPASQDWVFPPWTELVPTTFPTFDPFGDILRGSSVSNVAASTSSAQGSTSASRSSLAETRSSSPPSSSPPPTSFPPASSSPPPSFVEDEDISHAPEWFQAQYKLFMQDPVGGAAQDAWVSVMRSWYALETCLSFATTKVGFPTKHRPAEIALWIKNARVGRMEVVNRRQLYPNWLRWWSNINPTWRERADSGQLVSGVGGHGDWSKMWSSSGKNGFLNVIACLQVLKDVVTYEEWAAEVNDVSWVLQQVVAAKQARGVKRTSPSTDSDEAASPNPTQRPRTA